MTLNESIKMKLERSAAEVDRLIYELVRPRRPEVLYEAASHLIKAGGKRLRPYLVLKSCEIVGGDAEVALPFAAAIEILHNFTLIHDDVMDNDMVRRGVPTVHAKWGVPIAIASGDLLFAKVYEAMLRKDVQERLLCSIVRDCIERVTEAAIAISEGQVFDISFPRLSDVSEEDYFHMVGGKTAALFKACAEVGALVGGGDPREVERLGGFAWNAGIAFQLVDDYLGATADEETLGKPVGSDLREGKKTLIIIHALSRANPRERAKIESVLGVKNAPSEDVEAVNKLLESLGSLSRALDSANRYAEEAKRMLDPFPDSEAKRDLLELLDYFMKRTY
ncbi:MAG: polyprenyl synthetase family protein [Candidatus Bathyarchaeia archaeon]